MDDKVRTFPQSQVHCANQSMRWLISLSRVSAHSTVKCTSLSSCSWLNHPLHSSNIQNAALLGLICIYIFTKSMLTIYLFVKYILSYVTEVKVILSNRSCVTNEFLENFNFVSHQFQFVIVEDSLKFPSRNKLCTFTHSLQPALNFFQLDLSVSSIFYQFLLPLVNFICTNKQLANVNITSLLSKKYAFPHSGGFY